jgi:hypothetical protein
MAKTLRVERDREDHGSGASMPCYLQAGNDYYTLMYTLMTVVLTRAP